MCAALRQSHPWNWLSGYNRPCRVSLAGRQEGLSPARLPAGVVAVCSLLAKYPLELMDKRNLDKAPVPCSAPGRHWSSNYALERTRPLPKPRLFTTSKGDFAIHAADSNNHTGSLDGERFSRCSAESQQGLPQPDCHQTC